MSVRAPPTQQSGLVTPPEVPYQPSPWVPCLLPAPPVTRPAQRTPPQAAGGGRPARGLVPPRPAAHALFPRRHKCHATRVRSHCRAVSAGRPSQFVCSFTC